jgi:hypothetical protein
VTRDDIIRVMREVLGPESEGLSVNEELLEEVLPFLQAVAAAEREACAKVCDATAKKMDEEGEGPTGYIAWVTDCAAAIRARGQA